MKMGILRAHYLPLLVEFDRLMSELALAMPDTEDNEGAFLGVEIDFQTDIEGALCIFGATKDRTGMGWLRITFALLEAGHPSGKGLLIELTSKPEEPDTGPTRVAREFFDSYSQGVAKKPDTFQHDLARVLVQYCAAPFLRHGELPDGEELQRQLLELTNLDALAKQEEGLKEAARWMAQVEAQRRLTHMPPPNSLQ